MGMGKKKRGMFERIMGRKRAKGTSCCCNFQIEELPDKKEDRSSEKSAEKKD